MDRRNFFKAFGLGLLSVFVGRSTLSEEVSGQEFVGILVDTTRCIGCRSCEVACSEAHSLPLPDPEGHTVFERKRKLTVEQLTVVNRYTTSKGEVFVKVQCMHCCQPACVAACLVKAMEKRPSGHVTWAKNCMGCRFCMYSCPFGVPKFEYDKAIPEIKKCDLCWERFRKGKIPACVEACPQEALVFGSRRDLVHEGKARIYTHPELYYPHLYGENEVGGTSYLYLSPVPFEEIGMPTGLGSTPYPEYAKIFIDSDDFVYILWPAMMWVLYELSRREEV